MSNTDTSTIHEMRHFLGSAQISAIAYLVMNLHPQTCTKWYMNNFEFAICVRSELCRVLCGISPCTIQFVNAACAIDFSTCIPIPISHSHEKHKMSVFVPRSASHRQISPVPVHKITIFHNPWQHWRRMSVFFFLLSFYSRACSAANGQSSVIKIP